MDIPIKSTVSREKIGFYCDWGIIFSLCALIFVLPASIAFLDSFAALAVSFYLIKKAAGIKFKWQGEASHLNFLGKARFFWDGFAPPENVLDRPLEILVLAVFISVLFSQYPTLSLLAFFGKFIKCVFLYFAFIEAFNNEQRIWIFVRFFLFSAFVTVLSGIFQHYSGMDFIKEQHIPNFDVNGKFHPNSRISSTFYTANGFGAYLLPVFGVVVHLFYTAITRKRSWNLGILLAFPLVLLLTCLCWTYSRSSWGGLLVILFIMVLLDRRKIFYAGLIFLVFIYIFQPSLYHARHLYMMDDNSRNSSIQDKINYKNNLSRGIKPAFIDIGSGRIAYWEKAVSIIRLSPVWGTGLNTYTKILKRDPNVRTWWYAHNCYLQWTAETGFLGLGCFLWLLFVLVQNGLNSCMKVKNMDLLPLLQGVVCGLIGFLVQSLFDNTFYTVQLGVLMWLLFGLLVALTGLKPGIKEN